MDKERIRELLQNIGLSKWEITAYMVLIGYGPKTALELSKLSSIARSKTYEVITRLRRKGLVVKDPPMPSKGVTQRFVAIDPKKVFPSRISEMQELSKDLTELYKVPLTAGFPKINTYTSKEAIKSMFFELIKDSKHFYFSLSNLKFKDILGYSYYNVMREIKKKKNHFLLKNNDEMKEFSKEIKNFSFSEEVGGINYILTDTKVIIDLYKNQHIILEIISKEAVETFSNLYFNLTKIS